MDVVYYSYIILKIQCNLLILHIKLLNKSNLTIITFSVTYYITKHIKLLNKINLIILYYKLFVSKHIY